MSRCVLPIESEDRRCFTELCPAQMSVLEQYLTPTEGQMALAAIAEANVQLLQVILYNNDINLMMYQMLHHRNHVTVEQLLEDFVTLKSREQSLAQLIQPPTVLKSASALSANPSTNPNERINRVEADYVIGKLIEDHLSKTINLRISPKK